MRPSRFKTGWREHLRTPRSCQKGTPMKRLLLTTVFVFPLFLLAAGFASAADDSNVKEATGHVESGAKKIPEGKIGEGVEETAKGVGHTVTEGAKYSGEKV